MVLPDPRTVVYMPCNGSRREIKARRNSLRAKEMRERGLEPRPRVGLDGKRRLQVLFHLAQSVVSNDQFLQESPCRTSARNNTVGSFGPRLARAVCAISSKSTRNTSRNRSSRASAEDLVLRRSNHLLDQWPDASGRIRRRPWSAPHPPRFRGDTLGGGSSAGRSFLCSWYSGAGG